MNDTDRIRETHCCDHVAHAGKRWTECPRCGSRCVRDGSGAIVEYTRGLRDQPAVYHPLPRTPFVEQDR